MIARLFYQQDFDISVIFGSEYNIDFASGIIYKKIEDCHEI